MNAPLDEIKFLSKIEIGQKKITLKIEILSRNSSIRQREEILVYKLPGWALIILLLVIKLEREKHLPVRKEVPVY